MVINEGGFAGVIRQSYKQGYDVILGESRVCVKTEDFLAEVERDALPRKALGLIVEHLGLLPEAREAVTIQKDRDNQSVIWDAALGDVRAWKDTQGGQETRALPLRMGRLRLFQAEDGRITGIDEGILKMLETPERGAVAIGDERVMWTGDGELVILRGYRPCSGKLLEQWTALERVDWGGEE